MEKSAAIFATLVSFITASIFVYTVMIYKKPLMDDKTAVGELKEKVSAVRIPVNYSIDKLVVNLRSYYGQRLRFLDLSLHIIPFDPAQLGIIETNIALIHDSIIDVSGHMQPDELNSVAGKILFESRVKKTVNERLGEPIIKEILFSKFVVQ